MKLVPENLNEVNFERGQDPRKVMGLGKKVQIEKDLEEAEINPKAVEITDDFIIKNKSVYNSEENKLFKIQFKYLQPSWKKFVLKLRDNKIKPSLAIDDALDDGIDPKIIKELIETFGKFQKGYELIDKRTPANIYLTKKTRNEEKREEDEENNIYAFIGWEGKIPVIVNGEKYYKEGFETEGLIKIDKYDQGSLSNISGMKLRARFASNNASVYFVTIPRDFMDEERYETIPPEYYDLIVKYKQKI